jgi:hypothetical protein
MVKIYAKGNYFIVEDDDGKFIEEQKINVRVSKNLTSDTTYFILLQSKLYEFLLADLADETGTSYTLSSWETFAFANSGISQGSDSTPVVVGYVPYTGATENLNLGANILTAESIKVNGEDGLGHIHLKHQVSDASAGVNNTVLFADVNGDIKYKNNSFYNTTLKTSLNSANRVYTFPDENGTIALLSDIPNSTIIPSLTGNESFRGVQYANNSTTETVTGGVTMATTATAVARAVASTSYATKQIRKGFTGTVVSSGRYTGTRGNALLWYLGGGFKYVCDFFVSDTAYASGCRQFYGMAGQTTDLGYSDTVQVDSLVNIIGVGSDSSDTNLQIFHNDSSGVSTKIDLGVNFPSNRTAGSAMSTMYSVTIFNDNNSNSIIYRVKNNETNEAVEGTINTNLPATTQGLTFFASRCMGGGGGATNSGQFDLGVLGCYSL